MQPVPEGVHREQLAVRDWFPSQGLDWGVEHDPTAVADLEVEVHVSCAEVRELDVAPVAPAVDRKYFLLIWPQHEGPDRPAGADDLECLAEPRCPGLRPRYLNCRQLNRSELGPVRGHCEDTAELVLGLFVRVDERVEGDAPLTDERRAGRSW